MKSRVDTNLSIQGEPDNWVHSACILCSNGCGIDIAVKDGKIVGVRGIANHPVNFGHLGPKGEHAWVANNTKKRGTTVRKGDVFIPFHYGHGSQAANQHTWYARDAMSQQPHLKSSPVSVRRLSFGEPQPWLLQRLEELDGRSVEPFAAREYEGTFNQEV